MSRTKPAIKTGFKISKSLFDLPWFVRLLVGVVLIMPTLIIVAYAILVFLFGNPNPPSSAIFIGALIALVIFVKFMGFSLRWSILLVLVVLIYSLVSENIFRSDNIDCKHPEVLVENIKKEWNNPSTLITKFNVQGEYHPTFSDIQWKRNSSEPYITYRGSSLSYMYIKNSSLDKISKLFSNQINKAFIDSGFKNDELNSKFVNSPHPEIPLYYDFYSYGYSRNNELYWITLSMTNGDEDSNLKKGESAARVILVCGNKDLQQDNLYDELLNQSSVQKEIASYTLLRAFGIDKIYNQKVAKTSLFTYMYGGSGASFYLIKENNNWRELYKGQQLPSCSLLEDSNSGSGIECNDQSANKNRLTR